MRMKVQAICAASFAGSVRRAAGVQPVTSPPLELGTMAPEMLVGFDLLYFKLHGLPGQPYWYGDGYLTAISAEQLRTVDLTGAIVFAANCHLPDSPMLPALLAAGATAVVGGHGVNYARANRIDGADLLGYYFRYLLERGVILCSAFRLAKRMVRARAEVRQARGREVMALKDALAFKLWKKEKVYGIT